jgi:hypothetical protein
MLSFIIHSEKKERLQVVCKTIQEATQCSIHNLYVYVPVVHNIPLIR